MTLFENAYNEVAELVRKFDEHRNVFLSANRRRCFLQRKCDYLDGEIDRLVYELYGMTAEEIRIVEGV